MRCNRYTTPTPAPKPNVEAAASPAAPRVTKGRMMGLISRRPWFRPRCVVTASAATSPAKMPTFTLFSTVQKGCWLGASGSAELPLALKLCACMATLSKRIERRDFICSPVISCLSKMTVSQSDTRVHGPFCGMGGLLVSVTIFSCNVTCDGSQPLTGLLAPLARCLTQGCGFPTSNYYLSSYKEARY